MMDATAAAQQPVNINPGQFVDGLDGLDLIESSSIEEFKCPLTLEVMVWWCGSDSGVVVIVVVVWWCGGVVVW